MNTAVSTRQLGNTSLRITRIGLGAWAIGGSGWQYAWGPQEDRDSIAALQAGLDAGINWIDTAPIYGLGHSEEIVAKAIKGRAQKPLIFTKCSLRWDENGNVIHTQDPDSIRREVDESLRRLQVDTIDLYQVHWPDPEADIEKGWEALADIQRSGKVRYIGVSNFSVEQIERVKRFAPVQTLQPPYSLLQREVEKDILPYCERENIGVIVYSPMQTGLLTGKMTRERVAALPADDWRSRSPMFREPQLSRNLAIAGKLQEIGERHGRNAGQVAVVWTLRVPAVTGAIVGFRTAAQAEEILPALDFHFGEAEVQEIEQFISRL